MPKHKSSSYKDQVRNPDGTFYKKLKKGKEIDYFSESTLGNEAELDNDDFLEETLENEVELGEDNFLEVLENESNDLPSDWREILDNSDDSDIEWETQALFPNCTALFAFDNSTNHGSYKPDALVASRVNLNPGGKQPKMKDTVFEPNNIFQSMVFEDGIPKGMKQVLVEKNLRKE
ncbi:15245_t:CDS:2, partial [Entrophospora sp. SA101]